MMANADLELDKENSQTLQQAIHLKFGIQNASEPTISNISLGPNLVIPQLKIPQLNPSQLTTAEAQAAEEEHRRIADAHNERLVNAIKRRREQSEASNLATDRSVPATDSTDSQVGKLSLLNGIVGSGFTIPKLRTTSGEPLDEPQFNIPLLNKLRSQNNSLELKKLEKEVTKLKITADDGGDSAKLKDIQDRQQPSPTLIDLTSTVIIGQKDGPPREAASKVRLKLAAVAEHFDIPFISCDSLRNRLVIGSLTKKRQNSISGEAEATVKRVVEKYSEVGSMLDATVGYPKPRQPHLKYAASALELQHLKMYKREDYGANIKRFCFDTPSPDEIVKEALQKSWRISRT